MYTKKTDKLTKLIEEQENLLDAIKNEAQAIDSDLIIEQNEKLQHEIGLCRDKLSNAERENERLKGELSAAKTALFTKLADEKLSAFTRVQQRIDAMYYNGENHVNSRIYEYEYSCIKSLDETINAINSYSSEEYLDIQRKLADLRAELNEKTRLIKQYKTQQLNDMKAANNAIGERFKNEPLTESEKRAAMKQKSIESFIGLNVLSKAGILLFLVGIVLLGRFAYVHMSDLFKGAMIYFLGAILIVGGEIFHKKEKTAFSQALISGGTAVLYSAAASGFFAFHLYGKSATFIICAAITALAIVLSNQLKSQIVCAFAAIGGYLPVVVSYMITFGKVGADKTFLPVSAIYFSVFAIIIFIMTYNKKWYIPQFLGYFLHLIAIGGIASSAYSVSRLAGYGFALPLSAAFSVVSFFIYIMMPAVKIIKGTEISIQDIILLCINTFSGAVSVSITIKNCFASVDYGNRAMGFVFLAFSVIYALLMTFSIREKKQDTQILTAVTSVCALVFSMLVVPLIFGFDYAPAAWAAEGIIIALAGIEKKLMPTEIAGLICMILALICETAYKLENGNGILVIISFSIILSAFWIYIVRGLSEHNLSFKTLYITFEILTSVGSVLYLRMIYSSIVSGPHINVYSYFTDFAFTVLFIIAIALVIRLGVLRNGVSLFLSDLSGIVLVVVFTFAQVSDSLRYNAVYDYFHSSIISKPLIVFNLILLGVIALSIMLFFAKSLMSLIENSEAPVWLYSFGISLSLLMIITSVLMLQFGIKFSNVVISAIYIAAAIIMLVIGFKNSFTVVRLGGLVLVLVAFAKLCFIDTLSLDSGWKILSYFAFGAILIGISYVYQRFTKKLENENITK